MNGSTTGAEGRLVESRIEPPDLLGDLVARVLQQIDRLPLGERMSAIDLVRGQLDAYEADTLARQMDGPDDLRQARFGAATGLRSAGHIRRAAARAQMLKQFPQFADDLRSGKITGEQLDVIAVAAQRSDGAAVTDPELMGRMRAASPDQARKIVDLWMADRLNAAEVEAAHALRRRLRHARRGRSAEDLATITIAGDDMSIEQAWVSIGELADRMYQADGGRARPAGDHARTRQQRLYDAAVELVTRHTAGGRATVPQVVITVDANRIGLAASLRTAALAGINQDRQSRLAPRPAVVPPRRGRADLRGTTLPTAVSADSARSVGECPPSALGLGCDVAGTNRGGQSKARPDPALGERGAERWEPPSGRLPEAESETRCRAREGPHVSKSPGPFPDRDSDPDPDLDPEPAGRTASINAHLVGVGTLPDSDLARLLCDCAISLMTTDRSGQPLSLSRSQRTATPAQRLALLARDHSCVLCGSHHQHCEAHHLVPFNSPAKGQTNIDNLALVCGPCHRLLHDRHLTLERRSVPEGADRGPTSGTVWVTRPATPSETAAHRRSDQKGAAPSRNPASQHDSSSEKDRVGRTSKAREHEPSSEHEPADWEDRIDEKDRVRRTREAREADLAGRSARTNQHDPARYQTWTSYQDWAIRKGGAAQEGSNDREESNKRVKSNKREESTKREERTSQVDQTSQTSPIGRSDAA